MRLTVPTPTKLKLSPAFVKESEQGRAFLITSRSISCNRQTNWHVKV